MATQRKAEGHSFASIVLVCVIFGALAILVFVPVNVFETVRAVEQNSIRNWLGNEADQWVMLRIFDVLRITNQEATKSIGELALSGNHKIDSWLVQRVYATLVWVHLVAYRSGVLLMWAAFGVPVLLAAIYDGYMRREISKTNFSSRSPMLHKSGIDVFRAAIALMVAWLLIPWHTSMLVAPTGFFIIGAAAWLWISNAPKRM